MLLILLSSRNGVPDSRGSRPWPWRHRKTLWLLLAIEACTEWSPVYTPETEFGALRCVGTELTSLRGALSMVGLA